jgi:phage terminase large subunit-like protein
MKNYIDEYYKQIVSGKVVVGVKIRELYKHLVYKLNNPDRYHFDSKKAQKVIDFIEIYCKQSKGKYGGKALQLELWQKAFLSAVFGFVDNKGLREYQETVLLVARKNGKSTLGSAAALYMLYADGEHGPEIYSAATKREQAKIIWNESVKMIRKSPSLRRSAKCLVSEIKCLMNDGIFKPLAAESNTQDGLNISCALLDEIHAWKDKNLYDVIVDGETAREQPLTIIVSTMGTVRESIFDMKYKECEDVLNGYSDKNGVQDERFLPVVYELDNRKEWVDSKCWQKANPGLGTIKGKELLADKVERAKNNPLYVKNLLCKDFNIRETSSESFLTFDELNNTATFDIAKIKPRYGIGGFDLSQTVDLTCATVLFKGEPDSPLFYCHQMYWIPDDVLEKRVHEDKVPYDIWLKQGYLRTTPGNRIDYHVISEWFKEIQDKYDLYLFKVGYDRWSASYLVQEMKDYFGEATMEEVIQGAKTLSQPMQNLKAELAAKHIIYNNNPVLKWCMANARAVSDTNGNIKPIKDRNLKIRDDGFMSLLDAFTVYERNMEDYLNMI